MTPECVPWPAGLSASAVVLVLLFCLPRLQIEEPNLSRETGFLSFLILESASGAGALTFQPT